MRKTTYRFPHRSNDGKTYYWGSVSRIAGDPRVEQISAPVQWFWGSGYPNLDINHSTR